ncbi:adenylate kinase [Chloroflexota bacterium]
MYIVLLGAPGAGKGTQAAFIARELGLVHIATGDLFRQALAQGTELGLEAKTYMERGALVPDGVTMRMLLERIAAPDCQSGAILDGFPRNVNQALALDEAFGQQDKAIDKVVHINVSQGELIKRLSGRLICRNCQAPYHATDAPPKVSGRCDNCGGELYQRSDDSLETVKKRLEVYFKETAPVIDFYSEAGKLLEVAGEGSVDEVVGRIVTALRK